MKKSLFLFLCLFMSVSSFFAQRTLERKEKTEALSIFVDKDPAVDAAGGGQAGSIISCPITLKLSFSSNVDKTIEVYKTEERGDVRFYYLRFIVGRYKGASYNNRVLEVISPGFAPLKFSLDLQPSESKSFEIFDPNATVGVGCFYQHFNEGVELFKKALYNEAREKYRLSMECTDMPADAGIQGRIKDIDSILVLRSDGDKFYELSNFKDAMICYKKIVSYNINDEFAQNHAKDSENKFYGNCNVNFNGAELHFTNGDYDEAKKLYELVISSSCPRAVEANLRLVEISKIEFERQNRGQVIALEVATHNPTAIGITAGAYKVKKFSGYFSLRFTPSLFSAMQKDYEKSEKTEFDVSVGLTTMRLNIPVWGFFGVGYTGVSNWDYEDLSDKGDPKFHLNHALSPELGVLGKIGPVVLRYTFQYRFPIDKETKDYIGTIRHVFGLGVCF